jgi:hypothetical protein
MSDEARSGARELRAAGRSLGSLRDVVTPAARPWGDDEAGRAFESRYRLVETQILGAWDQLAQYVESLGEVAARSEPS